MKDCFVVADYAEKAFDEDNVATWFAPGRMVPVEKLFSKGITIHQLLEMPLPALLMCVRAENLAPFSVDMMKEYDDAFRTPWILTSSWINHLEPRYCEFIGLTMDALIEDGLTRATIRKLHWSLSFWHVMFGLQKKHLKRLQITNLQKYFSGLSVDIIHLFATDEETKLLNIRI